MKITLESTTKIVELVVGGEVIQTRLWQGFTEAGVPCFAFITRIAPAVTDPSPALCEEFERDLQDCRAPSPAMASLPPLVL